jgi:hypothetical protein
MKKLKVILSLVILVNLVYACRLSLDHPVEPKTVEVEIICDIDGAVSGSKAAGIVGDPAINTVLVISQDESGTRLGDVMLDKGTSSWTGSMSVTVNVGTPITFSARGYSGFEARGAILYYGKSEVTVSPSDVSLNVSINTALQETAQWAQSVVSAENAWSFFNNVAIDGSGNVFAVGSQVGKGQFSYGGVSATGTADENAMLVKYDSSGTAQWARTVSAGSEYSVFYGVAVDSSGNVYAAGYQGGSTANTYGPSVSATGTGVENVIIVKYDSSGTAQWARTVSAGSGYSHFYSVAVDSDGNVYAAGYQSGSDAYTYDAGLSVTGTSSDMNVILVKYSSSGTAQWARTVSAGSGSSRFNGVAVDSVGNVYAAGYQHNIFAYTYGPDVSATGTFAGENIILVKYAPDGIAQWARTVSTGLGNSYLDGVAVDGVGNVYAAGYQHNNGAYTYGPGVSATGSSEDNNPVLVKYNSSGTAQWARTIIGGSGYSRFIGVSVDSSGNVFAAGHQVGSGPFTYGPGVGATGTYAGENVILVKYEPDGIAQWARTVSAGSSSSIFSDVSVDSTGNVYTVGTQLGTENYTYGDGVSGAGTCTFFNLVLVKYGK